MVTRNFHQRTGLVAWLRVALLVAAGLHAGTAATQNIADVPMAIKNNVPPNFMFMIDNSGSMSNVVPTGPYNAATNYSPSGCTGSNVLGTATQVDLRVSSGAPRIRIAGTDYRHWTLASSGTDRRCFNRTGIYKARLLADSSGSPSGYLSAEYDGNYLNWYFGTSDGPVTGWTNRKVLTSGSVQTRLEIAKSSATDVVNSLPLASGTQAKVRVGLSAYNGGDGGSLLRGMTDLNGTHRTNVLSSITGLTASGSTPLSETLADIGRYMATGYSGNITAGSVSGVSINSFLQQDGRPSCLSGAACATSTTDSVPAPSTGTPTRPIQYWCQRSYAFLMTDGRPQNDQAFTSNTYLRDYDRDCSGALAASCTSGSPNYDRKSAQTYESAGSDYLDDVAKALYDVDLRPNLPPPTGYTGAKKNNLLTYTIGFADLQVQNDPLLIRTAAQGGGLFLSAQDGPSLTNAFKRVVTDAFAKDAAAAAVAVANSQVTVNNVGYASSYNSGSWYGDLEAYSIDQTTGDRLPGSLWSLQSSLDAVAPGDRKIASFDGTAGVRFTNALAGTPTSLTAGVIGFVRGDRTGEGSTYRQRLHVLGDMINAEPLVVNYPGDVTILFQGANDGMLHVVDARTDSSVSTRGQELWAYVPRLVHANLADLASPSYTHRYYVDGTPSAAVLTGVSGTPRVLVGGLGKGGRGFYALNITDYQAASEADAAAKVMWEFSDANMGYSFGTPLMVRTAAGWRALVTSGYDNGAAFGGDGVGRVWVLNPLTGAVEATLSTGVGTAANPAGLAHLSRLANTAADDLVRYVYGGDLLGNVWRFDLDLNTATRIAALTDVGGTAQPVTAAVEVGPVLGSATKFFVYAGTGRYLSEDDVPGTATPNAWATQRQTIYGLIDDTSVSAPTMPNLRGSNGATCPTGGGDGDLVCQSLSYGTSTYLATAHAVDPDTKRGWYLDLPTDTRLNHGRIYGKPALTRAGTLALTVNIPTNTLCEPGGRSWFFGLWGGNGGAVPRLVGGTQYFDAGMFLGHALASRVVVITTSSGTKGQIRLSDKTIKTVDVNEPETSTVNWRRIYWRSVR